MLISFSSTRECAIICWGHEKVISKLCGHEIYFIFFAISIAIPGISIVLIGLSTIYLPHFRGARIFFKR